MKTKTLYSVKLSDEQKALFNSILEEYDNVEGFGRFCDAISNTIKGEVTKQNLLDMCDCVTLIDENLSEKLDPILENVCDDLYKKFVVKS